MTIARLIVVILAVGFVACAGVPAFRRVRKSSDRTRAVLTCVGSGVVLMLVALVVPNGTMPAGLAVGLFAGGVLGLGAEKPMGGDRG